MTDKKVICYTCRFCKMDIRDGKPYCLLRVKGGKCIDFNSWESQEDALDKIRADLYKLYNDRPSDYNHSQRTELFCEVIKILDKYKAEQEGKE